MLLGQLATDQRWAGMGIGSGLLKHALQRCVAAAGLVGGRALMVNAVDIERSDVVFGIDMKQLLTELGVKPAEVQRILQTAERNASKAPAAPVVLGGGRGACGLLAA